MNHGNKVVIIFKLQYYEINCEDKKRKKNIKINYL